MYRRIGGEWRLRGNRAGMPGTRSRSQDGRLWGTGTGPNSLIVRTRHQVGALVAASSGATAAASKETGDSYLGQPRRRSIVLCYEEGPTVVEERRLHNWSPDQAREAPRRAGRASYAGAWW